MFEPDCIRSSPRPADSHLIIPLLPHHASTTSDRTGISYQPRAVTGEQDRQYSRPTQPRFQRLDTAHPIVVECASPTCRWPQPSPNVVQHAYVARIPLARFQISSMHVDWCRAHHAARLKLNRRLIRRPYQAAGRSPIPTVLLAQSQRSFRRMDVGYGYNVPEIFRHSGSLLSSWSSHPKHASAVSRELIDRLEVKSGNVFGFSVTSQFWVRIKHIGSLTVLKMSTPRNSLDIGDINGHFQPK